MLKMGGYWILGRGSIFIALVVPTTFNDQYGTFHGLLAHKDAYFALDIFVLVTFYGYTLYVNICELFI